MEHKNEEFRDLDLMEFRYLREFNISDIDKHQNKLNRLNMMGLGNLDYRTQFGILVYKGNGLFVIKGNVYNVIEDNCQFKVGQLVIYKTDSRYSPAGKYQSYIEFKPIADDILDVKETHSSIDLWTMSDINKLEYNKLVNEMNKQKEREELKKEEETKRNNEVMLKEEKEWNEKSCIERDDYKIEGNKLTHYGYSYGNQKAISYVIEINKKFSEIYDYKRISDYNFGSIFTNYINAIDVMIHKGIKEINVIKKVEGKDDIKIEINIKDKNSTLNGVRVNKQNILKVLRHSKETPTEDKIKLINSLGSTRLGFMEKEEIDVSGIKIPSSFNAKSKDTFTIVIGNLEKDMEWYDLVSYFDITWGGQRTNISWEKFQIMMNKYFDYDKKKCLDMLKEYKTLQDI